MHIGTCKLGFAVILSYPFSNEKIALMIIGIQYFFWLKFIKSWMLIAYVQQPTFKYNASLLYKSSCINSTYHTLII